MSHIHVDVGYHFVSLNSASGHRDYHRLVKTQNGKAPPRRWGRGSRGGQQPQAADADKPSATRFLTRPLQILKLLSVMRSKLFLPAMCWRRRVRIARVTLAWDVVLDAAS